ncbi:MAG TPA: chorismate synthase [Actinomycetota bacterium]|jgi:chorismate synthase|nr:chorismate synthase [Actinomycetota bacterium]
MLRFLTAGESHGPELVVIVEGMPAGIAILPESIDADLKRRHFGYGRGARSTKIENDTVQLVSGVHDGLSTGAPIGLRIINRDFANQPSTPKSLTTPRPGHADLAGRAKYGLRDFRTIRERASARETAARVAAGGLARQLLTAFEVSLGSYVTQIGRVSADLIEPYEEVDGADLVRFGRVAETDVVRCPDPAASAAMRAAIDEASGAGETLGGTFWVFATGVPAGLGSYVHWDRKLDGRLAQAVCSIPAIKGVEIGPAFETSLMTGGNAQDDIVWTDGSLGRPTNRAGGIEAGVTNGEPILVRAAMKPLSSVRRRVRSVDFETGDPSDPPYIRSDICAVPAAAVVAEAMIAWVLADAVCERFGSDRLDAMLVGRESLDRTDLPAPSGEESYRGSENRC